MCHNLPVKVGLFCIFATTLLGQDRQEFPPTVRAEVNPIWQVTGNVSNTLGLPVPAAKIYRDAPMNHRVMNLSRFAVLEKTTADVVGKFEISMAEHQDLIVTSEGFAPTAIRPEGSAVNVQLSSGTSVTGRLLLPNGKPAKGVIVQPIGWLVQRSSHFEFDQSGFSQGTFREPRWIPVFYPDGTTPGRVISDSDGRFRIDNLPDKTSVYLSIKPKRHQEQIVRVRLEEDLIEHPAWTTADPIETLDDDFVLSLKPAPLLKIEASEERTGSPQKIHRVGVAAIREPRSSNEPPIRWVEVDSELAEVPLPEFENGFEIFVVPEPESQLLGRRFTLKTPGAAFGNVHQVNFRNARQAQVRVVDEFSGKPVANAPVRWRTKVDPNLLKKINVNPYDALRNWDNEGNYCHDPWQTDENGEALVSVPSTEGFLAILGFTEGYLGHHRMVDTSRSYVDNDHRKAYSRFYHSLPAGESDLDRSIKFSLLPSFRVNVEVVDADGKPFPGAIVSSNVSAYTQHLDRSSIRRVSRTSDLNGKVSFDNWYNVVTLHLAAEMRKRGKSQPTPFDLRDGYPSVVEAFAIGGFQLGATKLPLPPMDSPDREINATLKLVEHAVVTGRIINTTGQPIADLDVVVTSGNAVHASQRWSTQTRSDGRFQMTGVMPLTDLTWELDSDRVHTSFQGRKIQIAGNQIKPGEPHDVGDVVCLDLTGLKDAEFPTIDLEGLSNKEVVVAIEAFVQKAMDRIPDIDEAFLHTGIAGSDPIPAYKKRLEQRLIELIQQLVENNSDVDFELQLLRLLPNLHQEKSTVDLSIISGQKLLMYKASQLSKSQFNNPNAEQLILETAIVLFRHANDVGLDLLTQVSKRSKLPSMQMKTAVQGAKFAVFRCYNYAVAAWPMEKFQASYDAAVTSLDVLNSLSEEVDLGETYDELQESWDESKKIMGSVKLDNSRIELLNKMIKSKTANWKD